MSIDLSQFHEVFFEESFEGLDVMEATLLELDPDNVDIEMVNTIFRSAHSIKGGSATFGFNLVAEFTHVVEALLDLMREGKQEIDQDEIDLFLRSVDCLRDVLATLQAKGEPERDVVDELKGKFEAILAGDDDSSATGAEPSDTSEVESNQQSPSGWYLYFKPGEDILRTGNEPSRMFRELHEMGSVRTEAVITELPEFSKLNPESCFLSWYLWLKVAADVDEINEIFEWVIDDSIYHCVPVFDDDIENARARIDGLITGDETTPVVPDDAPLVEPEVVAVIETPATVVTEVQATSPTPKATVKEKAATKTAEASSIRVGIDKIDDLINMVGELVITQSMLSQIGEEFTPDKLPTMQAGLAQLEHNTRELQEGVMRIRMLPISFTFSRFPRMVRDLSRQLNKKVNLVLNGENTELDKTVMEKIGDPLVHLVRNSMDHGIETPEQRLAAGKPETGTVTLNAFHQGGNIIIQIIDDGAGLNSEKILAKAKANGIVTEMDHLNEEQIFDLVFQPGFSTAEVVSDVSGRGVGMDVVRRNINELNGNVSVTSKLGEGATFSITLPLTLAILDGQLVRVGQDTYIFPLVSIVESLQVDKAMVNNVAGGVDVLRLRDEYVPIIRLWQLFGVKPDSNTLDKSLMVVVEGDGEKVGLIVDELLAQQQVVIKSLEQNYKKVEGVSGATILGDGTVALIFDIGGIIRLSNIDSSQIYKGGDDSRHVRAA